MVDITQTAPADLVERIARDQAKADQLNWDEPCLQDADNDIYCESSTCMAAFYEDHDADVVRQHYLRRARTAWETMRAYMASDGVTDADRAAAFEHDPSEPDESFRETWMSGHCDARESIQAFAAHRRAAACTPQLAPRNAQKYLVWSNEHAAWWGKDRCGYTRIIANAGRYSRDEALKIAEARDGGWHVRKGNPDEIAIPEQDAIDQYADITRSQEGQA